MSESSPSIGQSLLKLLANDTLAYLFRRLAYGVLTLMIITVIVYLLIRSIPGTPLTSQEGNISPDKVISEEDLKQMEATYGLDKHPLHAYSIWLMNLARLDLGRSFTRPKSVVELIGTAIGPTFLLSASSLFLTYLLSIPIGLYSTVRSGKPDERAVSLLLYMLYSLPSFVAALYLQLLLCVQLDLLPLMGMTSPEYEDMNSFQAAWDIFKHAFLPIVCFTYGSLAYYSRFVKANTEEVIRQDFIRTARAKGVPYYLVIWRHAFRNTFIPMATMIGLTLPALLGGAIILEQIFTWPGMGTLFFEALSQRDYPTIMGLVLLFSVLTLLGQLLADFLYVIVDPRISLS
ncbi:MAG: ABC transporter permease [bacterium]|nr:ABC transporter permease [bacterium]